MGKEKKNIKAKICQSGCEVSDDCPFDYKCGDHCNIYLTQKNAAEPYDGKSHRKPHLEVVDKDGRTIDWAYIPEMEKINPNDELMRP